MVSYVYDSHILEDEYFREYAIWNRHQPLLTSEMRTQTVFNTLYYAQRPLIYKREKIINVTTFQE